MGVMECKDKIIFKKIEEFNKTLRIQTTIGARCFSLVLIQEINEEPQAYKSSRILEQNLKTQADNLDMNVDVYYNKLISCFENPRKVKFDFEGNTLTLTEDVNSHLQVKYFQCDLEKVSNSCIGNLIDDLYFHKAQSEIQCKQLISENELLQKDVIEHKNKLNELVARKIIDEKTMLSNFVALLNEKKRRIQHLNTLLEAFKADSSLANPLEVNVACSSKRKLKSIKSEEQTPQIEEEVSESDDTHQDISTDEEHLADTTKSVNTNTEYGELFNESPTEVNLPRAKFPKLIVSDGSKYIGPSTSKEHHLEPREDNNKSSYIDHEDKMGNVDTQDWLDNL